MSGRERGIELEYEIELWSAEEESQESVESRESVEKSCFDSLESKEGE